MRTAPGKDGMIFSVDTEALRYDYFCLVLWFSPFTYIQLRYSFLIHPSPTQ